MTDVLAQPLVIDIDRPVRVGIVLIAIGFSGFLLWAAIAPITSAAVAPGVVVADSRNKAIQHLEGGIVRQVLVREGERVEGGQVLVRLDSASAEANLGRLYGARTAALAEEARLIAERDGLDQISFPEELTTASDSETAKTIKGQKALFDAKRMTQASERSIIAQRIAQYEEEIRGIEAQVTSEDSQLSLIGEEIATVEGLVAKGLEKKPRLLALQRSSADISGQRGQHVAEIARARQSIAEMQQRLLNMRAQNLDEAVSGIRDVQTKLADLNQQLIPAADASRRLEVKAPVSGKVIAVLQQTPGGVVKPGETILELLPDQDQLVIEAHVRPEDIDSAAPNAQARVRLTAYSQRRTSSLRGHVDQVSADRIVDQKGNPYYLARVLVDANSLSEHKNLQLYPGMPAVIFIEGRRQSMLNYLLAPLFQGIEQGFREQ